MKANGPKDADLVLHLLTKKNKMNQMIAKFNSKCAETGLALKKGTTIWYDRTTKKAYHSSAKIVQPLSAEDQESKNIKAYVQAQEDAFFDNFSQNNRY